MMTPERRYVIDQPLTLKERVDIHAVELAIIARRVQQLEHDQADIMAAFAADQLPVRPPPRNAKGWEIPQ